MFKSFVVVASGSDRGKKDLGAMVDEKVKSFLAEVKGELEDFRVETNIGAGGFGTAFVTVFYKEKKK